MPEVSEVAMNMLRHMAAVRKWALAGDTQALPYLAEDAIRVENGEVSFHKERFIDVAVKEGINFFKEKQ